MQTNYSRRFRSAAIILTVFMVTMQLPTDITAGELGRSYTLKVNGLACPFCAYGIEKQLNRISGVASISIDIESGTVTVTMQDDARLSETGAKKAVEDAGFTMRGFKHNDNSQ